MAAPKSSLDLAIPLLASLDMSKTVAFYRDKLGFEVRAQYGEDYAVVRRDKILLNFWPCTERRIAENTSCYINVTGVDALHAEFQARAPDVRMTAPRTFDHGMREFHVWDADGNLLRFGEPAGG